MDWNGRYEVSRALVFQVGERGEILVRGSLSGGASPLGRDRLPVLLAFAGGRTPRRALAECGGAAERDERAFAAAVGELLERRLLIAADGAPGPRADTAGFGSAAVHYPMIRDTVRVMSYRQAIARHCRGRTVLEIGCGSGLLSILAAQAGARRVIAIEESGVAGLAAEMFRANGVADRIELRRGNSRDVVLEEPAEVIIHELLGSDPFDEGMLPTLADARERMAAPGARLIPFAFEVFCVGFEVADAPRFDLARSAADLAELGALYGVDLGPVQRVLEAESASHRPPLGPFNPARFEPSILTDELELYRADLRAGAPPPLEPRDGLVLRVHRAGRLGGVLVYFRARLDDDIVLSTSPYAPPNSWRWSARPLDRLIAVEPGQEVPIRIEPRTVRGIEGVHLTLA